MAIGIDLVHLTEFESHLSTLGGLEKVFTEYELTTHITLESKAGVFAAKEAYMKAIGAKINWLDVWVEKQNSGKPALHVHDNSPTPQDISISHSGDYATAVVQL